MLSRACFPRLVARRALAVTAAAIAATSPLAAQNTKPSNIFDNPKKP